MSTLPQGVLQARLLDGLGGATALDADGLAEWTPEQGLLWIHLDYTDSGADDWFASQQGLPAAVADSLLTMETRPRVSRLGKPGPGYPALARDCWCTCVASTCSPAPNQKT